MKIAILPKFQSTFLEPETFELTEEQDVFNYQLPEEFIKLIRMSSGKLDVTSVNTYLIITKEK